MSPKLWMLFTPPQSKGRFSLLGSRPRAELSFRIPGENWNTTLSQDSWEPNTTQTRVFTCYQVTNLVSGLQPEWAANRGREDVHTYNHHAEPFACCDTNQLEHPHQKCLEQFSIPLTAVMFLQAFNLLFTVTMRHHWSIEAPEISSVRVYGVYSRSWLCCKEIPLL